MTELDKAKVIEAARSAWMDASLRVDKIHAALQTAEEEMMSLYADYVELQQPRFAAFFRRILRKKAAALIAEKIS